MPDRPTVQVQWERANRQGVPIDRWFANLEQPAKTFGFAQIERAPGGAWLLILFPFWTLRDHPYVKTKTAQYQCAKTAKKHLESWARANRAELLANWRMHTDH